jgi:hypothetical protein
MLHRLLYAVFAIVVVSWAFGKCSSDGSGPRLIENPAPAAPCVTMECKLAMIETQHAARESDPLTARMRAHLDALDAAYPESRDQIGDMTVKLSEILHAQGTDESLESLFEVFSRLPHVSATTPTYADVAAMYGTLRKQGKSREDIIPGLSAMIRSVGRLK